MKNTSQKTNVRKTVEGSGVVQVAIWRENPEASKWQDVFTNYSQEVFFDFSRPLKILDGKGWSPSIRVSTQDDFFVFSTDEI